MSKNIRPQFSTIVDPSEYDIDRQMEEWLKDANKNQACFHGIDVGKMWGLYLSWKEQQERIELLSQRAEELNAKYQKLRRKLSPYEIALLEIKTGNYYEQEKSYGDYTPHKIKTLQEAQGRAADALKKGEN